MTSLLVFLLTPLTPYTTLPEYLLTNYVAPTTTKAPGAASHAGSSVTPAAGDASTVTTSAPESTKTTSILRRLSTDNDERGLHANERDLSSRELSTKPSYCYSLKDCENKGLIPIENPKSECNRGRSTKCATARALLEYYDRLGSKIEANGGKYWRGENDTFADFYTYPKKGEELSDVNSDYDFGSGVNGFEHSLRIVVVPIENPTSTLTKQLMEQILVEFEKEYDAQYNYYVDRKWTEMTSSSSKSSGGSSSSSSTSSGADFKPILINNLEFDLKQTDGHRFFYGIKDPSISTATTLSFHGVNDPSTPSSTVALPSASISATNNLNALWDRFLQPFRFLNPKVQHKASATNLFSTPDPTYAGRAAPERTTAAVPSSQDDISIKLFEETYTKPTTGKSYSYRPILSPTHNVGVIQLAQFNTFYLRDEGGFKILPIKPDNEKTGLSIGRELCTKLGTAANQKRTLVVVYTFDKDPISKARTDSIKLGVRQSCAIGIVAEMRDTKEQLTHKNYNNMKEWLLPLLVGNPNIAGIIVPNDYVASWATRIIRESGVRQIGNVFDGFLINGYDDTTLGKIMLESGVFYANVNELDSYWDLGLVEKVGKISRFLKFWGKTEYEKIHSGSAMMAATTSTSTEPQVVVNPLTSNFDINLLIAKNLKVETNTIVRIPDMNQMNPMFQNSLKSELLGRLSIVGTERPRYFIENTDTNSMPGTNSGLVTSTIQEYSKGINLASMTHYYDQYYVPLKPESTKVGVHLNLQSLDAINYKSNQISLSMRVKLDWRDPRISYSKVKKYGPMKNVIWSAKDVEKLWRPSYRISNSIDQSDSISKFSSAMSNHLGEITYQTQEALTLSCRFEEALIEFPYDVHTCLIDIMSDSVSSDVSFEPNGLEGDLSSSQFEIKTSLEKICSMSSNNMSTTSGSFSIFSIPSHSYSQLSPQMSTSRDWTMPVEKSKKGEIGYLPEDFFLLDETSLLNNLFGECPKQNSFSGMRVTITMTRIESFSTVTVLTTILTLLCLTTFFLDDLITRFLIVLLTTNSILVIKSSDKLHGSMAIPTITWLDEFMNINIVANLFVGFITLFVFGYEQKILKKHRMEKSIKSKRSIIQGESTTNNAVIQRDDFKSDLDFTMAPQRGSSSIGKVSSIISREKQSEKQSERSGLDEISGPSEKGIPSTSNTTSMIRVIEEEDLLMNGNLNMMDRNPQSNGPNEGPNGHIMDRNPQSNGTNEGPNGHIMDRNPQSNGPNEGHTNQEATISSPRGEAPDVPKINSDMMIQPMDVADDIVKPEEDTLDINDLEIEENNEGRHEKYPAYSKSNFEGDQERFDLQQDSKCDRQYSKEDMKDLNERGHYYTMSFAEDNGLSIGYNNRSIHYEGDYSTMHYNEGDHQMALRKGKKRDEDHEESSVGESSVGFEESSINPSVTYAVRNVSAGKNISEDKNEETSQRGHNEDTKNVNTNITKSNNMKERMSKDKVRTSITGMWNEFRRNAFKKNTLKSDIIEDAQTKTGLNTKLVETIAGVILFMSWIIALLVHDGRV